MTFANGLYDMGPLRPKLVIALAASWMIILISCLKGIKSSGKVALVFRVSCLHFQQLKTLVLTVDCLLHRALPLRHAHHPPRACSHAGGLRQGHQLLPGAHIQQVVGRLGEWHSWKQTIYIITFKRHVECDV